MTKYEEIYLISGLLSKAKADNSVELNKPEDWQCLYLNDTTKIHEDFLIELDAKGILNYEEIGEDGFKPIIMCSIKPETARYLNKIITEVETENSADKKEIDALNRRINEILTFDPKRLSDEINSTETIISQTREQLKLNPVLSPLMLHLKQIEIHFKSLSKVAHNYEEVYKNIILPVREEGKSGVRQTVRWAIISIIVSTLISLIISWLIK